MRVLVDARDKLGISWQSCENEKQGMLVMSWEGRVGGSGVEPSEFQLYVMALSALWADTGIQEAYARRSEFQLVSRLTTLHMVFPFLFHCSSLFQVHTENKRVRLHLFISFTHFPPKSG